MRVEPADKDSKRPYSFSLSKPQSGLTPSQVQARMLVFACDTEEEYRQWFPRLCAASSIQVSQSSWRSRTGVAEIGSPFAQ